MLRIPIPRHLGYEGNRHTGCYGFGGRWAGGPRIPVAGQLQYHLAGSPHFLATDEGWAQLRRIIAEQIIDPPTMPGAAVTLGGGYDGLPVFLGWCPCMPITRPQPKDVYSFLQGGLS
jgi:hypothetical protein